METASWRKVEWFPVVFPPAVFGVHEHTLVLDRANPDPSQRNCTVSGIRHGHLNPLHFVIEWIISPSADADLQPSLSIAVAHGGRDRGHACAIDCDECCCIWWLQSLTWIGHSRSRAATPTLSVPCFQSVAQHEVARSRPIAFDSRPVWYGSCGLADGGYVPPKARSAALRFTHVHLENWRNFSRVDNELEARLFLVGPNASGKSNFLDVFRFLHDIVAVGGGFQQAVKQRGGVSMIRCLAARRYPDISVRVVIGRDEHRDFWEYELRFKQDNLQRPFITSERVVRQGQVLLDRPTEGDQADQERLSQTYLEQVNVNREFRDIADFLLSVRYLHIVPQLVREPDRSVGKANDPYVGDFLEQLANTPEKTRNSRLRRISEALRVAVPQLKELEMYRDPRGTPHLRGKYEHWRRYGAWQSEDHLSDGTLRLMGLLWALLDGSGPLLLEEPELSLHPEVVRLIPQIFARVQRKTGRQILISTHSTDLLLDEGIGLDEVFWLQPEAAGTSVHVGSEIADAQVLLEAGAPLAEVVMPHSKPGEVSQLALFGD